MVIWFTGLSGAGKTTICETLYRLLKPVLILIHDRAEVMKWQH